LGSEPAVSGSDARSPSPKTPRDRGIFPAASRSYRKVSASAD
jgi:hypothetical protein